jgi:methylthioribulose-1-phosphate dehydratase
MEQADELTQAIHVFFQRGWAPATSSNYSFRDGKETSHFHISESGIDKGAFESRHFLTVDMNGRPLSGETRKPSAETLLHCAVYRNFPRARCVLHTHSALNTVLSQRYLSQGALRFSGLEILKGFAGIRTHEAEVAIPVFANSQNMEALAAEVENYFLADPRVKAFLLAGHGMYTWGESVIEAKRHVEVVEFLLECERLRLQIDAVFPNFQDQP